jgi:hypothetical protein
METLQRHKVERFKVVVQKSTDHHGHSNWNFCLEKPVEVSDRARCNFKASHSTWNVDLPWLMDELKRQLLQSNC